MYRSPCLSDFTWQTHPLSITRFQPRLDKRGRRICCRLPRPVLQGTETRRENNGTQNL